MRAARTGGRRCFAPFWARARDAGLSPVAAAGRRPDRGSMCARSSRHGGTRSSAHRRRAGPREACEVPPPSRAMPCERGPKLVSIRGVGSRSRRYRARDAERPDSDAERTNSGFAPRCSPPRPSRWPRRSGCADPVLAATGSDPFTDTGENVFTVPPGVTSVDVRLIGAAGIPGLGGGAAGGAGATATATLAVRPGETLFAEVGGGVQGTTPGAGHQRHERRGSRRRQ